MTFNVSRLKWFLTFSFWFLVSLLWWFWSYILVDGNLVLSRWSVYWHWQEWLWQRLLPNSTLLAGSYLVIVVSLFAAWLFFLQRLKASPPKKIETYRLVLVYFLLSLPFLLAYNALSHDVFNYIFNAKMVVVYQANPHVKTALDFSFDPLTRFMHNTHTPAPYGYGWTGLSLIPYFLGLGKFSLTWLWFKLFSFLSLVWLFFNLKWVAGLLKLKVDLWQWATLFLNPLILIEILSNAHNDFWMMSLFLTSIGLSLSLIKSKKLPGYLARLSKSVLLILSLFLFLFAGWIKLASFVTTPLYGILLLIAWFDFNRFRGFLLFTWIEKQLEFFLKLTPLIFSVLFFLLLLTDRSKQFLPWYLSWSLVFLPLLLALAKKITLGVRRVDIGINFSWLPEIALLWSFWLVAFSFSSLLRYLPWLYYLSYSPGLINQQRLITWLGGLFIFMLLYSLRRSIAFKLVD